jgi:hypothetical protein
VVFASNDIDQSEFNSNSKSMPWMKLQYENPTDPNSTAQKLLSQFGVKGLPSLVVLDQSGNLFYAYSYFSLSTAFSFQLILGQVISSDGRGDITSSPTGWSKWFAVKDRFTDIHAHELLR